MANDDSTTRETAETARPDERLSRRTVLGAVGATLASATGGCLTERDRTPAPELLVDATVDVEPGQFETFDFVLERERWVTVGAYVSDRSAKTKVDGPGVDVVVMSSEQYDRFRADGTFAYAGGVSMPDVVNGEVSDAVDSGEYVALVDNTPAGAAKPGESGVTSSVELEIVATASRRE